MNTEIKKQYVEPKMKVVKCSPARMMATSDPMRVYNRDAEDYGYETREQY